MNDGRRRVRLGLGLLTAVAVVGTGWFWLVEGFSPVDAAYQTVMTVTTVGFGEVEPLGTRARLFAIALMVVGVGVALYAIVGLIEDVLEHQLGRWGRKRMERRIEALRGHVVICGYGRVGRGIVPLLADRSPVVVVDREPDRVALASAEGLLVVEGDATDDEVLVAAGLARASTLIVSLQSDADAISAVLSARALGPDVRIVARANAEASEAKLVRAGVDHVVNPLRLGAVRLATFALQPVVADFVDLVAPGSGEAVRLEQVVVPAGSPVLGRRLGECGLREATGVLVLALRRPGGEFTSVAGGDAAGAPGGDGAGVPGEPVALGPGDDAALVPGATLVVLGTPEQLAGLDRWLRSGSVRAG